ncbi:hypothetical protein GCM10007384_03580 [Aquimarina muelleri]|uniref:Uncharacterized protein n=1 Tax=Aquimarina muelleri TaxID=279356 RepID=A0A918N1N2_9FLAO|nr:hypothetical protein GCM10007384_03580 [Aquimarina muelleri]
MFLNDRCNHHPFRFLLKKVYLLILVWLSIISKDFKEIECPCPCAFITAFTFSRSIPISHLSDMAQTTMFPE